MERNTITHSGFVNQFREGKLSLYVVKSKAGNFIMSGYAYKGYKWVLRIFSWTGIILWLPLAIALFFVNWKLAILSFFTGMIIVGLSQNVAGSLAKQNMINNEDFWDYILLHGGAKIVDQNGNDLHSAFLHRMSSKD